MGFPSIFWQVTLIQNSVKGSCVYTLAQGERELEPSSLLPQGEAIILNVKPMMQVGQESVNLIGLTLANLCHV